jgi:hypothetical protein
MNGPLTIALGVCLGIWLAGIASTGLRNPFDKDDTDGNSRSGLSVLVDYGTGVQYVMNSRGGMTVRVDADGKPMTINQEGE